MTEVYRTPDENFEDLTGYSFEPHYLDLNGDLAGIRMHYVDEGVGEPILLLHGEPTWAYLYRKMIPSLAQGARAIAPDLVGFGRSDKPTDRDWYSYERHLDSIVQLIVHLGLESITLVVQDWGGPIGLRVATTHRDRFAHLVILNTGLFRPGPKWPSDAFLNWRNFAEANPDLPIGFILQGATTSSLGEDVVAAYEAPFPTVESKAGAAAFPLLVPLRAEDPGAAEIAQTRDILEAWHKPVLVAFSDEDPIFPQRSGERLAAAIPGAIFVPIEGASHFLQEDKGEEIAGLIRDWLGI